MRGLAFDSARHIGRTGFRLGRLIDIARLALFFGLALSCDGLLAAGAAAQGDDCARLQAAIAAPARSDPAAAVAAQKVRAELDKLSGYAHSIGCDNQQFLFFGQAPPPQCGGVKARIGGLRAQYDSLMARGSGDGGRRDLIARYNASCRPNAAPAPREKGFFETLFGGGEDAQRALEQAPPADAGPPVDGQPQEGGGGGAHGGSQAVCVRTCDGGFFPLPVAAHNAGSGQLLELCKALCPNAEVELFTRNPDRDISTAMSISGEPYEDLPNAMKYAKSFDPACGCKPPTQSWVEALAHAEQVLDDMGDVRASDAAVTEQQSKAMSQPLAVRQLGRGKTSPAPPPAVLPSDSTAKIVPPAKPETRTVESQGPDGAPRQVRVIGPNL